MYLKSLQIAGFKSFAHPVRLDLGPGITAVVGPNGSGKSNVVDAIRWVLGEQSPRALRGNRGEDVIFGGSAARHPLGMAEVVMVLDNSDRRVGLDVEEVAIGRRLYRSGETEYLVNRKRARLKDVQDLVAQAGLGPHSYCVVGQGAIDQLVMQRPQERQGLIADAADTRRHELRLAEAEAALVETQEHARRLQAVMAELRPQRDRLRAQAERAERHRAARDEVEALARAWFGHAVPAAKRAQETAEDRHRALIGAIADAQRRISAVEVARAELQAGGAVLRDRARAARQALDAARAMREALRVEGAAAAERLEACRQRQEALEREIGVTEQQLEPARSALAQSVSAAQQAQDAAAAVSPDRERLAVALAEAEERASTLRGRLSEAQRAADRARRRLEAVDRELQRLRQRAAEAAGARAVREERERVLEERIRGLTGQVAGLENEIALRRQEVQHLEEQCKNARLAHERARSALQAAERGVREAERTLEGLLGEERAARKLAEDGVDRPASNRVMARLAAPLRFQRAIAAAIGEAARYTVVDARGVAWHVDPRDDGHLVLVPRPAEGAVDCASFRTWAEHALEGVVNFVFATDVLEAGADPEIAARFLGHTVIVATITEARLAATRLAERNRAALAFAVATEDGQCLRSGGERVLRPDSTELRAIEARAERERLGSRIAAARAASAEAARRLHEAMAEERETRVALRTLEEERNAGRARLQQAEERRAALARDLAADQAALEQLRSSGAAAPDTGAIDQLEHERSGLWQEVERSQELGNQLTRELAEAERAREAARAARAAAEAEVGLAAERAARLRDAAERDAREVARLGERLAALASARDRLAAEGAELERRLQQIRETLAVGDARVADSEREVEAARADLNAYERRLAAMDQQERAVQAELIELRGQESEVRTAIEHARGEVERLSVELAAVADLLALQPADLLTMGPAVRSLSSTVGERDAESWRRRLARAQRELRSLGAVDYGLLAEYARVQDRYQFLTEQLDDLTRAEARIRATIEEVRDQIREQFMAAYEDVNARFKVAFQELFQGGDAELVLTGEPGAPDCAVDVLAQPPGKRLHRLVALSGGERALVGAALLLALIGANPSPFCVLDEVDAALDEINVGRFLEAVRRMATHTQFILVTHNRATMEVADALYGVTMSPGAVSQVLAMRLGMEKT